MNTLPQRGEAKAVICVIRVVSEAQVVFADWVGAYPWGPEQNQGCQRERLPKPRWDPILRIFCLQALGAVMEQQRAHDRDRTWAEWMRAANAGDEIAYRRLLEALAPFLRQVVRRGFCSKHSSPIPRVTLR